MAERLQHTSAAVTAVQLGNDLAQQLIEHKALNVWQVFESE